MNTRKINKTNNNRACMNNMCIVITRVFLLPLIVLSLPLCWRTFRLPTVEAFEV